MNTSISLIPTAVELLHTISWMGIVLVVVLILGGVYTLFGFAAASADEWFR